MQGVRKGTQAALKNTQGARKATQDARIPQNTVRNATQRVRNNPQVTPVCASMLSVTYFYVSNNLIPSGVRYE